MRLKAVILAGLMLSLPVLASAGPSPGPPSTSGADPARPGLSASPGPGPATLPSPGVPKDETPPPAPTLDLLTVLREAITQHPAILAAQSNYDAARALARGAGKWTNPRFQIGVATIENNNNSNQVNQDIELFGQYALRGGAAKSDAAASGELAHSVRRQIVRDAASAYYDVWVAVQDHDLQQLYVDAIKRLCSVSNERSEGKQTHEVLRSKVELSRGEAELTQTEANRHVARARLNAARGRFDDPPVILQRTSHTFELDAPQDPYPQALPPLDELLAGSDVRPEVQQQKRLVDAAALRLRLANRSAFPWLGVQGNLSRWNYNTASRGFQFTLNLPIFDWGRLKAERQQITELHRAAQHNLENVTLQVHLDVRTSWISWQSAVSQQEGLRKNCPNFQDAVYEALEHYQAGTLSIDDTINTLRASRLALHDYLIAEGAVHTARINVLWASGLILRPEGLPAPKKP